jgi:hypothetical protein
MTGPCIWRNKDACEDELSFEPVQTSELDFLLGL